LKTCLLRLVSAAFLIFLSGFFIVAAGAWLPLKGVWVDRLVSDCLTRETGIRIQLYDCRIVHWRQVRFGLLTITDPHQNKILLASGSGTIRVRLRSFLGNGAKRLNVWIENIAIMEDLYRKSPLITWASEKAFKDPIFLKSIHLSVKKSGEGDLSLHVLNSDSQNLLLNGGISFHKKQVSKVHALVLLPEERFEEVPKEIRARMIPRKGRWRGIRLIYSKNHLKVVGQAGPFFEAEWNHGQA